MNSSQLEYTLDTIIDAIESNAFKHAEALCEKALKKWPGNTQILALKALILWYNSKTDQSKTLVQEVLSRNPTDFMTLSVLERMLESQNDYDTLATLFESALKTSFDDRIAERLFFFYLRLGQTKKLYPIAAKLYTTTKQVNFAYWSVLGLVIHSSAAESSQERVIQLELAKRTLMKLGFPIGSPKQASDHKQLLMIVYDKLGDFSGLAESSKIKTPYDPSDDPKILLRTLIQMKDYSGAFEVAEKIFKADSCLDFEVWKLVCTIPESRERLSSRFIPLMEENHASDIRGVKLAKIHFNAVFREESLCQDLLDFAIEMRSKGSMVFDIIQMLQELDSDTIQVFANLLHNHLITLTDKGQIVDSASLLFVARFLNHKRPSSIEIPAAICSLVSDVCASLEDVKSPNYPPANLINISLYSCLSAIDSYFMENDLSHLRRCYHQLCSFSKAFPETYSFHLIKFIVAANLGIFLPGVFEQLEIKCLQLDTLGFLITEMAPMFVDFETCRSTCKAAHSLYESNNRDTWNLISQSLDNGSIISALDFYEFSGRLEGSSQSLAFDVAHLINCIMTSSLDTFMKDQSVSATIDRLRGRESKQSVDNRDFKVFDSIDACGNLLALVKRLISDTDDQFKPDFWLHLFGSSNYNADDKIAARISAVISGATESDHVIGAFNSDLSSSFSCLERKGFDFEIVKSIGMGLLSIKQMQFALERSMLPSSLLKSSFKIVTDFVSFLLNNTSMDLLPEQKLTLNKISDYIKNDCL